ncbi:MAG: hypothetical protein WCJ71_02150 [Candidatus Omnitrophota bacterium]
MLRTILVDDHKTTLEGLRLMLERLGLAVVATNSTGLDVDKLVLELKAELVF